MKKFKIMAVICFCLLFIAGGIVSVTAEESFEIGQTPLMIIGENDVLTIDGNIDAEAEIWNKIPAATVDETNSYTAWSGKSVVVTENIIRFAYDSEYLYLSCLTYDDSPVPSTGIVPEDEHGFDGDTVIFQFDPTQAVLNSEDPQVTSTWYCFSADADKDAMACRTYCGTLESETDEIICAADRTENSWAIEAAIPWTLLLSDIEAQTGVVVAIEDALADMTMHNAKLIYMNRYAYGTGAYDDMHEGPIPEVGEITTICRSFTPCDMIPGTQYPGYAGNPQQTRTCGIYLYNTDHVCEISDEWVVEFEGSCDIKATDIRPCIHCGRAMKRRENDYVHDWDTDWTVIEEPTCADGMKAIKCKGCEKYRETEVMPAILDHEKGGSNIVYAVNYNEYTERYELYCERCGMDIDTNAGNISYLFPDVADNSWYAGAVAYCYTEGIVSGISRDTLIFSPHTYTTRGMFVTVLGQLHGIDPKEYGAAPFEDVYPGMWYTPYISWALSKGYAYGYSDTRFGPEDTMTREQMISMLYRYSKAIDNPDLSVLDAYRDKNEISDYAVEAMAWAVDNGVISGTTAVTLSPKSNTTRAELARIMMNFRTIYR